MANNDRIAVNLMVKDGGAAVLRALQSIASEVDELVVFDTGSTDGTQDAVRNYLASLPDTLIKTFREVPWVDDFSAIRNQMLEATQSEWVFALDADEVLSITERTLRDLIPSGHTVFFIEKRSYLKRAQATNFAPVRGEFPALERGYVGYQSEPNFLFFRRRPEIRYHRLIHETIETSLEQHRIPSVRINHVVIHNFGRHDMSAKGARYKRLVEKLVAAQPQDGLAWYYLALHEKNDNEIEPALPHCERALELLPHYAPARLLYAECLLALGRRDDAMNQLRELLVTHPRDESVWLLWLSIAEQAEWLVQQVDVAEKAGVPMARIYEAAAAALLRFNKPVKAQRYKKLARDLLRR